MKTLRFLLCFATVVSANLASASNETSTVFNKLEKGTNSLEAGGVLNVMGDDLQFQVAYERFIGDGIGLALVGGLRDDDVYMSTELGIRVEYNLIGTSPLVPFLDAGLAWINVEVDENNINTDAALFSASAGLKYFIQDNLAIAFSGTYLTASDDLLFDSEDGEMQDNEFRLSLSLRYYFD